MVENVPELSSMILEPPRRSDAAQGTGADEILASVRTVGVLGAGQMSAGDRPGGGPGRLPGFAWPLVDQARADANENRDRQAARAPGREGQAGREPSGPRSSSGSRRWSARRARNPRPSIAVEAATENIELKSTLFRELDAALGPDAVLAANTSSISITLLAAQTKQPDRVVGMPTS